MLRWFGRVRLLKVVHDASVPNDKTESRSSSLLDEIVRDGTRGMLAAALQWEFCAYIEAHADQLDSDGYRLVVRNGSVVVAGTGLPRPPDVKGRQDTT